MKTDKKEFLNRWGDYVDEFVLLGHSTEKTETWDKIKRQREDMRKLVHEIAGELYGK